MTNNFFKNNYTAVLGSESRLWTVYLLHITVLHFWFFNPQLYFVVLVGHQTTVP